MKTKIVRKRRTWYWYRKFSFKGLPTRSLYRDWSSTGICLLL